MEGPDTGLHGSYPVPALDNSVYIGPEGKRKADREMYLNVALWKDRVRAPYIWIWVNK